MLILSEGWRERVTEAVAVAADSGGGVSDQVRRSEVLVCGFLTGVDVPLCIVNDRMSE